LVQARAVCCSSSGLYDPLNCGHKLGELEVSDSNKDDTEEANAILEMLERLATFEPPVRKRIVEHLNEHVREDKLKAGLDALKERLGKLPGKDE